MRIALFRRSKEVHTRKKHQNAANKNGVNGHVIYGEHTPRKQPPHYCGCFITKKGFRLLPKSLLHARKKSALAELGSATGSLETVFADIFLKNPCGTRVFAIFINS